MQKSYTTHLPPSQWQVIQALIKVQRKSKWPLQGLVEAILYQTKNGGTWRDLPGDFPPWQTVYWYFVKWQRSGTIELISTELTMLHRLQKGRPALPRTAIIDAQSVRTSETACQQVGFDGYKRIKGRQRLLVVDTLGNVLWTEVVAANRHEGATAGAHWAGAMLTQPLLEELQTVYADASFGGLFEQAADQIGQVVEIPKEPIAEGNQFIIKEKRWIVERNFAWLGKNRRLSKDYERVPKTSEAFVWLAHIRRTVKFAKY